MNKKLRLCALSASIFAICNAYTQVSPTTPPTQADPNQQTSSAVDNGDNAQTGPVTVNNESEQSPFAPVPAYLDSETASNNSTVKPRVTLVIDDSGSMRYPPYNAQSGQSKLEILKEVLGELIGGSSSNPNEDFSKNIKYNLVPLWGNGLWADPAGGKHTIHTCPAGLDPFNYMTTIANQGGFSLIPGAAGFPCVNVKPVKKEYMDGATMYSKYISKMHPGGTTPTTASYVGAVNAAYKGIEYTCQRNYVIVLSDGDTNFDMRYFEGLAAGAFSDQIWYAPRIDPANTLIGRILGIPPKDGEDFSEGDKPQYKQVQAKVGLVTTWNDASIVTAKGSTANTLTYPTATEIPALAKAYGLQGRGRMPYQYLYAYGSKAYSYSSNKVFENIYAKFKEVQDAPVGSMGFGAKFQKNRIIGYGGHPAMDDDNRTPIKNGIAFFSHKLYNNDAADLITDKDYWGNSKDKEGNAWTGNQNIQTIAIGFGDGLRENGKQYLKEGAEAYKAYNPLYKDVNTGQEGSLIPLSDSDGEFGLFNAMSKEELRDAFVKIFTMAVAQQKSQSDLVKTSVAKPTNITTTSNMKTDASGNPIKNPQTDKELYQSLLAVMGVRTGNWSSVFNFYYVDNGANANSYGDELTNPHHASYLTDGAKRYKVVVNSKAHGNYDLNDSTYPDDFGFEKNIAEFSSGFVPWISREGGVSSTADDDIEANVQKAVGSSERIVAKYRNRVVGDEPKDDEKYQRMMGDVLDSAAINIPDTTKNLSSKDKAELDAIDKNKTIVVGANDGMLYIYQRSESNKEKPYDLKMTFLPADMPREDGNTLGKMLPAVMNEGYGQTPSQPHIYGVNGDNSYVITSAMFGRNQEAITLTNMGQGGRGAFALKIGGNSATTQAKVPVGLDDKNKTNWTSGVPMWTTKNGDESNGENISLGYTVSAPVLTQLAKKYSTPLNLSNKDRETLPDITKNVVVAGFIANGHPTANKSTHDATPTLYAYDALGYEIGSSNMTAVNNSERGKLIRKISVPDTVKNPEGISALASPTLVDINFDGLVDVVYAGDYDGNLWRFDLRYDTKNWQVHKIFEGDTTRPITAAPAVYRIGSGGGKKYVITFGTGSDIYNSDRTDEAKRKNIQRIYGIYDDLEKDAQATAVEKDLLARTITIDTKTKIVRKRVINEIPTDYPKTLRMITPINACDVQGSSTRPLYSNEACKNPLTGNFYKGWYADLEPSKGDEEIGELGAEMVVTQPQMLLNTALYTTRAYAVKNTSSGLGNTSDEESCNIVSSEGSTTLGTSYLLGLNVLTGGIMDQTKLGAMYDADGKNVVPSLRNLVGYEITTPTIDTDTSSSSGSVGIGTGTGGTNNNDKKQPVKGEDKNIASALTLVAGAENNVIEENIGVNGENKNGVLAEFASDIGGTTPKTSPKNNSCVKNDDYLACLSASSGGAFCEDLKSRLCQGGFIRTSVREIKYLK